MRNKIIMIVSLLTVVLVMNSCLKDNVGMDWSSSLSGKMYAEVWKGGLQSVGLAPVATPVQLKFMVNIASDQPPTQDITVTLGVSDDARIKYNSLNGTSYKLYPYIKILTPDVLIKAGTRNSYAYVEVWNANLLDPCDKFMAPITIISSTGGVIPAEMVNNGSRLYSLSISNPWAGDYQCVGYRIRPGNPTEPVNQVENLSTVSCKSVSKVGFGNYSAYNVLIEVTSNTMVVGGTTCYKVIATPYDPATSDYTIGGMFDTWTGDAASAPPPPANPTEINYYNPVTKKFYLNCYYKSSAGNRIMWEVLTRI